MRGHTRRCSPSWCPGSLVAPRIDGRDSRKRAEPRSKPASSRTATGRPGPIRATARKIPPATRTTDMPRDHIRVTRALLSVSDKDGLVAFATALAGLGVELVSTGGTHRTLSEAGLAVTEVAEVTRFPEMMDGRVKTLHPAVHGGLLAVRDNPEHQAALAAHGIGAIDLLVVNLYPFEETLKAGKAYDDCVENIDVGGPAMIRAAAKNHADVASWSMSATTPPSSTSCRATTAPSPPRPGGGWRRRRFRAPRATMRRSPTARRGRGLGRGARIPRPRRTAGPEPPLRREPAPERVLLPPARTPAPRHRHRSAGAGQGTLLQQPQRHRRGL